MEDARDGMVEDSIGSAKPPKARKPRDPDQTKRLLLQVIAVATVATAVASGINAWESHQERSMTKTLYCEAYAGEVASGDDEFDRQQKRLRDALGC